MSETGEVSKIDYQQVENKLLILYLFDKMDIPLSNSQVSQFALEEDFMHYYTLRETLEDMVDVGYLEKSTDNNTTRYSITPEGQNTLELLEKQIPVSTINKINKYVAENRKSLKRDYEITANYFYEHNTNEYIVKCAAYDEDRMLLELNCSVVSKDEAKQMCANWKANINMLYGSILGQLLAESPTVHNAK